MSRLVLLVRSLVVLTVASAGVLVLAPAVSAHGVGISITCQSVTFNYRDFKSGVTATTNESVSIDGTQVVSKTFTFTGPTGSDVVPISVGAGTHTVTANADWTVQGGGSKTKTATLSGCPPCPGAPTGYPNLAGASQFAVFALNGPGSGGKQTVNFSLDTVNGDVGVASGATVTNQAPSTVNGNVLVDSGGSFSGPGKVNGSVLTGQDLSSARTDAINASAAAAGLSHDFTFGNITSNQTVTGVSGLNVVDVNGDISLNNASLTLTGPGDAFFVVNVTGSINLVGSGGIQVGGAVPSSQLLVNLTGSGANLIQTHVGNVIQGTLLGPNAGGSLDGAFGSVLLGRNFTLLSGVQVTFEGCR
jgi:hypothetical protein